MKWRDDDLSIEALAAIENPIRMRIVAYNREIGGNRHQDFNEVPDVTGLNDAAINGFVGCPILNSHSTWSSMTVVCVIDDPIQEPTVNVDAIRSAATGLAAAVTALQTAAATKTTATPAPGARSATDPVDQATQGRPLGFVLTGGEVSD